MTKTRIFFDVSALPDVGKAVTGISRVVLSLIQHIVQSHDDVVVQGISFRNEDAPYRLLKLGEIVKQANGLLDVVHDKYEDANVLRQGDCILLLGEQWLFPKTVEVLEQLKADSGITIASMVHDLVPFFMPELYWDGFPETYIDCIKKLVAISDTLIVYSDSTQKDLLKHFPLLLEGSKTVVKVRLGDTFHDIKHVAAKPTVEGGTIDNPYILCVGTIQPRKNHLLLLTVWRYLLKTLGDKCPTLLLVGKPGWQVDDLMYFLTRNQELRQKIHVLEEVSDSELHWLYQKCFMSVYPSFYEGWGLPIGESLSAHRLCLSSNTSSMPEVGGDLVDYFSPYDSGELYRLILQYITDPEQLNKKEYAIRTKFQSTQWSRTAEQIVNICKSVKYKAAT